MTKVEIVNRLKGYGYDAPKSLTKPALEAKLNEYEARLPSMSNDSVRPGLCWWLGVITPMAVAVLGVGAEESFKTANYLATLLLGGSSLAILFVSLNHLAEGIQYITGSNPKLSWCFAIAVDIGLVGSELAMAVDGWSWWALLYMIAATGTSMALNVHGFFHAQDDHTKVI